MSDPGPKGKIPEPGDWRERLRQLRAWLIPHGKAAWGDAAVQGSVEEALASRKVYIVNQYLTYEPGNILGVYVSEEVAEAAREVEIANRGGLASDREDITVEDWIVEAAPPECQVVESVGESPSSLGPPSPEAVAMEKAWATSLGYADPSLVPKQFHGLRPVPPPQCVDCLEYLPVGESWTHFSNADVPTSPLCEPCFKKRGDDGA